MTVEAAALTRQTGQPFGVQVGRKAGRFGGEDAAARFGALKVKEADAFFYISDAMVMSQAQLVIDMTTSKKLPTMFSEQSLVVWGACKLRSEFSRDRPPVGEVCAEIHGRCATGGSAD